MNKNQKFDPNRSISEENKGILNLYNGTIKRPEVCIVPNTVIFDPKGPEDKKPPDINKLREKKRLKMLQKEKEKKKQKNIKNKKIIKKIKKRKK